MNHFGNSARRSVAALLLALACLDAASAAGFAQASQPLPPALIVKKDSFSAADTQATEAFVAANKAGLLGDADAIRTARGILLRPLADAPSLNFRLAYAAALRPVLDELVATGRPATVINALRIAGEAGATGTLAVLFGPLDVTKEVAPAIRIAASVGLARMFEITAKFESAVNPADLDKAVSLLIDVASKVNDPDVCDAALRSLGMALRIGEPKANPTLQSKVVDNLATIASMRAQGIKDLASAAYMPAVLRVAGFLREVVTDDSGKTKQLAAPVYKNVAAYAGDLAVAIVRLRNVQGIDKSMVEQASGAAGTIVVLSNTLIDRAAKPLRPPTSVDELIGPTGWLTKPPFNFAADRFVP